LMVPFQCETCHIRNVFGRNPWNVNNTDPLFCAFVRRANLDAFWSREPPTVQKNLRECLRMQKAADRFGFESAVPVMGPFPLEDTLGMQAAVCILDRSLDPGIYGEHVQWETFLKAMSAVTNCSQAGVDGLGDSVGAYERKKMWISKSVSHQFWFSRFMEVVHKRVGEIRKQDEPTTIEVMKAVQRLLEERWNDCPDGNMKIQKKLAEMGAWFVIGFCTGLRGEDMALIELAGTKKSMETLESDGYFKVVLNGRTKGNQLSGSKVSFPCVAITQGNNLNPGVWVERLVKVRSEEHDKTGRLFHRRLVPARISEFENDFFELLEAVQLAGECIKTSVDVRSAYGILRSLRRGVTGHARNMKVDREVIEAVNRWRKETMSNGVGLRLDLIDVYTALDSLLPTLLEYSRAL